jgi:hypothetical protein
VTHGQGWVAPVAGAIALPVVQLKGHNGGACAARALRHAFTLVSASRYVPHLSDDGLRALDDFRSLALDGRFPLPALTMKRGPGWRPTG